MSPPLEFSAEYEVITTFEGSITSRSLTFPKSSKSSPNAPANNEEPIVFDSFRPCVALYSKSCAKGPILMSESEPESANVHSPESRGNSKFQFLSTPGPKLVTPSIELYFLPSLVMTDTSRPPIGTGASFDMEIVVWITSSSSSSISILISRISALKEPFFPEVAAVMSPTIPSTNATVLEYNHKQRAYLKPPRVFDGSDQSTAAKV